MTSITDITSKRRWAASVTVGVILTAALAIGTVAATSASAEEHRWDQRGDHRWDRQWQHHDNRNREWNNGYYRSPPVIYGPQYYSPPVVYGPGLGLNFNFR